MDGRKVVDIAPVVTPKTAPKPVQPVPSSLVERARAAAREHSARYQNGFESPLLALVIELAGAVEALRATQHKHN